MPKLIKKRVEKKGHKNDDIQETVTDIRERLRHNQRTLIYSVGAFIVIVAAVAGFTIYSKVNTSTALDLEYEGYRIYHGEPQAQAIPVPERYQKALEKFKKSYAAKKRPAVLLYIANCYYELGNYDETIKTLKDFNNKFPEPQNISLSYYKMAMAYAKKGDMNSALNSLNSLSSIKDGALHDMALMESGKILESMGKTEEARNKYKELVSKFPKSALLNEAKMKLGEK